MITNSNDLKSSLSFFHWFSNTENIFQRRSFFKMRLLFAIYFIVNFLALLVVLVRARQQSCTTNHCGEISKDIKTLHTEVKNLIGKICALSLQVPFRIIYMGASFNVVVAQILKSHCYLPHSLSLLFLQGTVRLRKVSTK